MDDAILRGRLSSSREVTSLLHPLPHGLRNCFDGLPVDPPPAALIRDSHYWTGNERSAHLWYQAVQARGGTYLGVGTDLNYTLAGWARAEFMIVVDFDQSVIDLHHAYLGLLERCETPEQFLASWSERARTTSGDLLRERWAADPRRTQILQAFRMAQPMVTRRLNRVRRQLRVHALPSFIDDRTEYDHVRTLACNGRIVVVRGDYNGNDTLTAVAVALRAAKLRLGVVYLSNVEQYLEYTPNFCRNFLALDIDTDAVVVRTLARRAFGLAPGEHYHYNVQSAVVFADWLRGGTVRRLDELLRFRTMTIENGLSVLECAPP